MKATTYAEYIPTECPEYMSEGRMSKQHLSALQIGAMESINKALKRTDYLSKLQTKTRGSINEALNNLHKFFGNSSMEASHSSYDQIESLRELLMSFVVVPVIFPLGRLSCKTREIVENLGKLAPECDTTKQFIDKQQIVSDLFKEFNGNKELQKRFLGNYATSAYIPNFEEMCAIFSGKTNPKQPFGELFVRKFDDLKIDIFNDINIIKMLFDFYSDTHYKRFCLATAYCINLASSLPHESLNNLIEALDNNYQNNFYNIKYQNYLKKKHIDVTWFNSYEPECVAKSTLTQYAKTLVSMRIKSDITDEVFSALERIKYDRLWRDDELGNETEEEIKEKNPEIYEKALELKLLLDTSDIAISAMNLSQLVTALSNPVVLAAALDPTLTHLFSPAPSSAAASSSVEIKEISSEPQSSQVAETPPEEMKATGEYVDQAD